MAIEINRDNHLSAKSIKTTLVLCIIMGVPWLGIAFGMSDLLTSDATIKKDVLSMYCLFCFLSATEVLLKNQHSQSVIERFHIFGKISFLLMYLINSLFAFFWLSFLFMGSPTADNPVGHKETNLWAIAYFIYSNGFSTQPWSIGMTWLLLTIITQLLIPEGYYLWSMLLFPALALSMCCSLLEARHRDNGIVARKEMHRVLPLISFVFILLPSLYLCDYSSHRDTDVVSITFTQVLVSVLCSCFAAKDAWAHAPNKTAAGLFRGWGNACSYLFYTYLWIQIIIAVLPFYTGVIEIRPFWLVGFLLYANIKGPTSQNVADVFGFTVTSNIFKHGYGAAFSEWSNWWTLLALICAVMHNRSSQEQTKARSCCKDEDGDDDEVVLNFTAFLLIV